MLSAGLGDMQAVRCYIWQTVKRYLSLFRSKIRMPGLRTNYWQRKHKKFVWHTKGWKNISQKKKLTLPVTLSDRIYSIKRVAKQMRLSILKWIKIKKRYWSLVAAWEHAPSIKVLWIIWIKLVKVIFS